MAEEPSSEKLVGEAVENLVTQFSSSLDFLRELVQNSIDAGSSTVDVWMEHEPSEHHEGVISIHVDDYGEGMTEEIIDGQLTRLFASTKDGDLTKIGKFGIGFVSVFALHPKGVLLHTGRDGEYWEVFFHEDRSFTKTRLDAPVEGTQITLFLTGDHTRYAELVRGCEATLKRWCAHSDTEITFEDRTPAHGRSRGPIPINEDFVAPGDCGVSEEHPGTLISVAFSDSPIYGFYNRGLALAVSDSAENLLEGRAGRFGHISLKVKSRYLEHTLSRETVMRDENYEKAMALVEAAVEGPLRRSLVDSIVDAAREPWSLRSAQRYRRLLGYLCRESSSCLLDLDERLLLRTIDGRPASLSSAREMVERDGRALVNPTTTSLTEHLLAHDVVVFDAAVPPGDHALHGATTRLLVRYFTELAANSVVGWIRGRFGVDHLAEATNKLATPEQVYLAATLDPSPRAEHQALLEQAQRILDRIGGGYRELRLGHLDAGERRAPLFALGRSIGPLMARPPDGIYRRGLLERPSAVVHAQHPHFSSLASLHRSAPDMAAYCLAKSLLLEEDRLLERDLELVSVALDQPSFVS